MQIIAKCPKCDAGLAVAAEAVPAAIKCGGCGCDIPLSWSDGVREDRAVDCCPVCQGGDFYLRKDFDPKIGLTVVIIGALISAGFYWYGRDLIAYSILGAATLIDLVVYGRLGEVTICYRCHSEFRGQYPRTAVGFDLHTADVLEMARDLEDGWLDELVAFVDSQWAGVRHLEQGLQAPGPPPPVPGPLRLVDLGRGGRRARAG